LNADGYLYYVTFRKVPVEGFWPDSPGFKTIDEAKASANITVPGDVVWE
jgi:hypothetical protein